MPTDLRILDVKLSPPRPVAPEFAISTGQELADIVITVRNASKQKTLHVISSLRSLRYDRDTQTLYIGLNEPPPNPQFGLHTLIPPSFIALSPGETQVLQVTVPLVIHRMKQPDQNQKPGGSVPEVEAVDISGFQQVHCTIAYSETPFQPMPEASGNELRMHLNAWSKTVERTLARKKA